MKSRYFWSLSILLLSLIPIWLFIVPQRQLTAPLNPAIEAEFLLENEQTATEVRPTNGKARGISSFNRKDEAVTQTSIQNTTGFTKVGKTMNTNGLKYPVLSRNIDGSEAYFAANHVIARFNQSVDETLREILQEQGFQILRTLGWEGTTTEAIYTNQLDRLQNLAEMDRAEPDWLVAALQTVPGTDKRLSGSAPAPRKNAGDHPPL